MYKLMLILALFRIGDLNALQSSPEINWSNVPVDVQRLILKQTIKDLIEVDPKALGCDTHDFEKSVKKITDLTLVDRKFHALINQNMSWVVKNLADRFGRRSYIVGKKNIPINELYIAQMLGKMPGTKTEEFKRWLAPFELRHAVEWLDVEKVKKLLAKGVDVNDKDRYRRTALSELLSVILNLGIDEKSVTIFKLLMDAGADINTEREDYTALVTAITSKAPSFLKEVLLYNPDITLSDRNGQTPIYLASLDDYYNPEIMDTLINYVKARNITLNDRDMKIMKDFATQGEVVPAQ